MKILLDSMMPDKIGKHLAEHEVTHVVDLNWQHLSNGQLLAAAEERDFDVLVTKDANMPYQQNLLGRKISLVVVKPDSQDFDDLAALAPAILFLLPSLQPGSVHRVTR